ncbi:hypothetical protein E5676_scaffold287G00580 [Cucumis melo var. makuwa]|uniref:Aminotransferase-like plant mobile domain-containing protein n=1 Tax=Cucumis melo var. makuwa TaxID=1194695 RepID=A0A5D3C4E5_CUCMM|nr:hypothetical protein E5676_scaffold287G00580 [Cucumis melo var. makuwa]
MQLYRDALLIRRHLGTMVYFTERFLSGVRHLVILSDRNQPREDGLSLIVEKPWAGAFADHWPRLDNNSVLPRLSVEIPLSKGKSAWVLQSSIHNEASNSSRAFTLGKRLIEGQTRWGTVTKYSFIWCRNSFFVHYDHNSDVVRAFCEAWCPSTNTLHTMVGELSISLWDLWSFGGLSIKGDFYVERIPSFKELTSTSRDKTKCLPMTYQYLFQAYYSIVCTQRNDRSTSSKNDSQVTIGSWISFWYLGSRSYDKPTTRKQKKVSRSKSTENPDDSKIQAREWSSRESMLFVELRIKDDLKDETYLAAFLSCWLCLFVFPQKGSFIRPGVFRAASLMAAGIIYSLAVPVFANIYHGLDWWTTKHVTYFEDNRHHLVSSVIPLPSQPRLPKNRGSNLGGKEIRLVEAMAPNLEEEVKKHKDESDSSKSDRHWKRPLKKAKVSGDHPDGRGLSALEVPDVPPLSPLNDHLEGLIEPDNDESLMGPHAVDSTFEEVGKMTVRGKDLESPSSKEGVCPKASLQKVSSAHAPLKFSELPLGASNKKTTRNPEPSQSVGEKVVSNFFQKTTLCMWEDIQDKIMRTPFEYIPRLRPEIATVLSGIEKIHADGLTSLEEYLNSYLKRVINFNDVQSSYSAQLLSTDKARQLNEKTSAIKEALTLVKQLRGDTKVIQERIIELSLERKEFKKRLRSINAEFEQLSILSCEKPEAIDQQELEVAKLQDEVNTLESTPAITEEAIEALASVYQSMEAAREEFKNFKWRL